jgi:hypothetical protein
MGRMAPLFPHGRAAVIALMATLAAAAWPGRVAAEDPLPILRAEFQRQKDPVKRAKLFPKLGNALLAEMRKDIQAKEFDRVPPLLLEYRDGAKAAFEGLAATGRDADKHPAGFRELEMHLRQSLHVVNDIIFALPLEEHGPLMAPQRDLELIDQQLVKALFPGNHEGARTPPSSSQSHPQK